MKRMRIASMAIGLAALTGCAATTPDANYAAYTTAIRAQAEAGRQPTLDLQFDEIGRVKAIKTYAPPQAVKIEQAAPHPGWGVLGKAVSVAGNVGAVFGIANAVVDVTRAAAGAGGTHVAAGGDITATDSVNTAGRDYSHTYSPETTTTTTTTTTDTVAETSEATTE